MRILLIICFLTVLSGCGQSEDEVAILLEVQADANCVQPLSIHPSGRNSLQSQLIYLFKDVPLFAQNYGYQ